MGIPIRIFYKHFLISPIFYEGSTLINFSFLIKEDFWYVVSTLQVEISALLSFLYKTWHNLQNPVKLM